MRCLVLGATGYVGRRLVPLLCRAGHEVRCLVRSSQNCSLDAASGIEIVTGDVLNDADVRAAMEHIDVVYYLVHALGQHDFPALDRHAAHIVADAAEAAHIQRLVYLGGLSPSETFGEGSVTQGGVSAHLTSRSEVGTIFLDSCVPTVVLRASIIIGSGSTSFEMLRYLTARVPFIPLVSWAQRRIQPIAIADVLHYLLRSAALPDTINRTFDIGGLDIVSYRQLIQRYARVAGLPHPVSLPAPRGVTRLATTLVGIITPIPSRVARPLIESLAHDMICQEHDLLALVGAPPAGPTSLDQAMSQACAEDSSPIGDSTVESPARALPGDPLWAGGPLFTDDRALPSTATPARLWDIITGIGGDTGWYTVPGAWTLRGIVDHIVGGPGLYRGRSLALRTGDVLDFWRIHHYDIRARRLMLRAEMKMPGTTILEMSASADHTHPDRSIYHQKITFAPTGLAGHLYWWLQRPAHDLIFATMARNIVATAEHRPTTLVAPLSSLTSPLHLHNLLKPTA
jgi:uncharacterized protein YbjT (DUF2867 family)